jgi:23S rRNA (uracil1939-C5)-methyltransferase
VAIHEAVEAFVGGRARGGPARPTGAVRTVIVDPPRTGMSRDALSGAIALAPRRIVYVSCDVATLARDARRLVDAGFHVGRADAFDLFPNTPHVETVVVFEKSTETRSG